MEVLAGNRTLIFGSSLLVVESRLCVVDTGANESVDSFRVYLKCLSKTSSIGYACDIIPGTLFAIFMFPRNLFGASFRPILEISRSHHFFRIC
jgi:hypothetical protein